MSHKVLAEELTRSASFIEVGSSYIVNMFYITELRPDGMTIADIYTIQIPQRQSAATMEAYRRFITELCQNRPDMTYLGAAGSASGH